MEKACDYDIHELMALAQMYVSKMTNNVHEKQSAPYEPIHLYKKLYFNPGFSI